MHLSSKYLFLGASFPCVRYARLPFFKGGNYDNAPAASSIGIMKGVFIYKEGLNITFYLYAFPELPATRSARGKRNVKEPWFSHKKFAPPTKTLCGGGIPDTFPP